MKITYELIKGLNPCYNPEDIGITKGYSATIPEFIRKYRDKVKKKRDIIWLLCRDKFMTDKELMLFAVWCARQVQHIVDDKKYTKAIAVAERHANGLATDEELKEAFAMVSARDSARDSASVYACAKMDAVAPASAYTGGHIEVSASDLDRVYAGKKALAYAMDRQIDRLLEIFIEKEKHNLIGDRKCTILQKIRMTLGLKKH